MLDNWDGPGRSRERRAHADDDAERTARALKLWDAAKPIAGTLAARYLAEIRGIDLDALPADIGECAALSSDTARSAPAPGIPACSR